MKMSDLHIEQMERDESPSTIGAMKTYKVTRIETVCIEIEAEDDAEMRALYTDGTVDDHCSDTLWNDPDLTHSEYVYEVDGNVVDIWKEEEVSNG